MEELTLIMTAVDAASSVINAIGNTLSGLVGIAQRVAQQVTQALGSVLDTLKAIASTALEVAGAMAGVVAAGFAAVAKTGVDMNIALNQARVGLTAITGSAQAADQYIAALRETARLTAPTFKELLPIGQQLAAVYGPQGLGQAIETIKAFDNAGKVLAGGSQDAISRALVQFRQLAVSPTPRMMDVRLIEENLPGLGIQDILKKAFGTADTETLGAAGRTGREVADALVRGMQEKFGQVGGQMAHSIPILFSSIQDSFNDLAATVTERLSGSLGTGLEAVSTAIEGLSQNRRFLDALSVGFDLLGKAIEAAAGMLPQVVEWLSGILTRENVVNVIAGVGAAFQTVADEVTKFLSAVMGGRSFESVWEAFGAAAHAGIDVAVRSWNALMAGIRFLSENAGQIFGLIGDALKPIGAWLDVLLQKVQALIVNVGRIAGNLGGGPAESTHIAAGFGSEERILGQVAGWVWNGLTGSRPGAGGAPAQSTPNFPNIGAAWQGMNVGGRASGLWSGFSGAVQGGYGHGLDEMQAEYARHAAANAAAINRALGPGGGAAGSDVPPSEILFPGRAGGGGAAAGGLDPKEVKRLLALHREAMAAQLAAARAQLETLPVEQQAVAALSVIVPQLEAQARGIQEDLQQVQPNSKEYWGLVGKFYQTQKQIMDLHQAATKEQARQMEAMKRDQEKAAREAHQAATGAQRGALGETELAEAQVRNNPFLNSFQRTRALADVFLQRFRTLNRPVEGETQEDALRRLTQAEGARGDIIKALGLQTRTVRTLGGGTLDLTPAGAGGVWNRLNSEAAMASRQPFGGGYSPTINIMRGVGYDEAKQLILEEFDRAWGMQYPGQ